MGYVNPKLKEASLRYSTYDYSVKFSELKNPAFAFGYFFGYTGTGYTYIHIAITFILEFIGIYLWKREDIKENEADSYKNNRHIEKSSMEETNNKIKKEPFLKNNKSVKDFYNYKSNNKPNYKEAKKKIYELKKLLDDGIINKDEYEKSAAKYKKILLED